ncbi:DUF47 domain-containing protein [archaeon]|nr:DUF47 domain-containing protein [archaeon]
MRGSFKLLKGSETDIYDQLLEEIDLMVNGAELLHEAVADRDYNKFNKVAEHIVEMEQECDKKSQQIIEKLIKEVKSPVLCSNLLKLAIEFQDISKAIESVAFRITMCYDFEVPEYLKKELLDMTDAVIKTLHTLKAVSYMPFYEAEALEEIHKIHQEEERVDTIRRKLICDFLKEADNIGHRDFYLFMELVNCLENVADRSERAAEAMEIIIASR